MTSDDVKAYLRPRYPAIIDDLIGPVPVETAISPGDGMFTGNPEPFYFYVGCDALRIVLHALSLVDRKPADVGCILDFACGHGRVARMLRAGFPHAALTVSDTDADGLAFCAERFGARTEKATATFDALDFGTRFDVIWCGSLLTHMDAPSWSAVLRFFHRHTNPDGVIVFTTHGDLVVNRLRTRERLYNLKEAAVAHVVEQFDRGGFAFHDYPWSVGYGISVSAPAWVRKTVGDIHGLRVIAITAADWGEHQDAVVSAVDEPDEIRGRAGV